MIPFAVDAVRRRLSRATRREDPSADREPQERGSLEEIRHFDEQLRQTGERDGLDPRTWADLDLDAVFRRLDRTASAVGQQVLYARLRAPASDREALAAFDDLVTRLGSAPGVRDLARKALSRLSARNVYGLPSLLFGLLPPRPALAPLFPVLTAAALVASVLAFFSKGAILLLAAICAVNIVVRLSYRRRIATVVYSLPALRSLVRAGQRLQPLGAALPPAVGAQLDRLVPRLAGLLRTTSWLVLEAERRDELTQIVYEYANMVLLLDVNAFFFSLELIQERRGEIRELYETVGDVDAALAVHELRESLPVWSRPEFDEASPLRLEEAVHPLLGAPVPNSLELDGRNALVTGSNMAGKTTFLKTVGVAAVLSQAVATSPARRYRGPFLTVLSAIGRTESLAEGTSYYLAEVHRVRELVAASERPGPRLFLLDELFRGTNTLERIAAGKAVLSWLARGRHATLVSTHDIELVPLLSESYAPYHFRETVTDGGLTFDYRLRPGPSSTRNAIALLAAVSLPEALVADALGTVDRLERSPTLAARLPGADDSP